ncbi:MAG: hypothetical protein QOI28_1269, partial [Mycobacterium sp.]|nr:hypothetical protein [Mycobacterium sp.]
MGSPLDNGDILNDRTSATSTTIYGRPDP